MDKGKKHKVKMQNLISDINIKTWAGVFKNGVLRKIFGHKREEVAGTGENCIMRSFMIDTLQQTL